MIGRGAAERKARCLDCSEFRQGRRLVSHLSAGRLCTRMGFEFRGLRELLKCGGYETLKEAIRASWGAAGRGNGGFIYL